MKVAIVGTGYVGLVSGVCLAEKGHRVTCIDIDQNKVNMINDGLAPIFEAGLEELLKKNIRVNLTASVDLRRAILDAELSMIAVGTPFDGREIDLTFIKNVAAQIGSALKDKPGYHAVVVKSTVVPGTTDRVVLPILERTSGKKAGKDFGVGMNPEFLKEGEAIPDFMYPDRIVLGGMDARSIQTLERLYEAFAGVEKIRTNTRTAEMIKYTANSLLATLISFSNEIGNLCAVAGVDVTEVMHGVHLDRRFSPVLESGKRIAPSFLTYLAAGCGFGGSCFPKDVKALIAYGDQAGHAMRLLESVMKINELQPGKMLDLLKRHYPNPAGLKVAVLGVAFKPETDDIRESPALPVIRSLLKEKAVIKVYDPVARQAAEKVFGAQVVFCDDLEEAIAGAAAVLIMTRWKHFERIPGLIARLEHPPVVIDGRRMLDKKSVPKYEGIGLQCA